MLFLNVLVPALRPRWFWGEHWTTGKETFWVVLNVSLIGLGNVIYFAQWRNVSLNWGFVLWFQLVTWAVAAFPIVLLVLRRESRQRAHYQKRSAALAARPAQAGSRESHLHFPSQNKGEKLSIADPEFRFARSADNYLEIYYRKEVGFEKALLRNNLKQLSLHFAAEPELFRCHKTRVIWSI